MRKLQNVGEHLDRNQMRAVKGGGISTTAFACVESTCAKLCWIRDCDVSYCRPGGGCICERCVR